MRSPFIAAMGLAVLLAPSAGSLGGVAVHGIGTGARADAACGESAFVIDLVYLPAGEVVLNLASAVSAACPLQAGGILFAGQVTYSLAPPGASVNFMCHGTEAEGVVCAGGAVQVGPYQGLGGTMTLRIVRGADVFEGSFVAW